MDPKTKAAAMKAIDLIMGIVDQADAGKLKAPEGSPEEEASEAPEVEASEVDPATDGPVDSEVSDADASPADGVDDAQEAKADGDDDFMSQLGDMARPEAGHGPEIQKTFSMLKAKKKGE